MMMSAASYYYNDALPERSILGAVLNTGMNSAKAETSSYLTLQEKAIRLSHHTVVVILVGRWPDSKHEEGLRGLPLRVLV
jgi:hexokinase